VPAPSQAVLFRDGGPDGEEVQRRIIEGLPRHLARPGLAQIVTELGERDGEPMEGRLRQWLGGAPMDIHILRLREHTPQAYALAHADGEGAQVYLEDVDRWHANLRDQGFDRVVSVLLAFRWSEAPWSRVDEAQAPSRDAWTELETLMAAQRLSLEPGLWDRLRAGRVGRTGPVVLLKSRVLGSAVAPTAQARLVQQAMPMAYPLGPLEEDLLGCLEEPVATRGMLDAATQAGIPAEAVLEALEGLGRSFPATRPDPAVMNAWSPTELQVYLQNLPRTLSHGDCAWLDGALGLTGRGNYEILVEWLTIAAGSGYAPVFPRVREVLTRVGRMKYLRPLYAALGGSEATRALARDIFAQASKGYHGLSRRVVQGALDKYPA